MTVYAMQYIMLHNNLQLISCPNLSMKCHVYCLWRNDVALTWSRILQSDAHLTSNIRPTIPQLHMIYVFHETSNDQKNSWTEGAPQRSATPATEHSKWVIAWPLNDVGSSRAKFDVDMTKAISNDEGSEVSIRWEIFLKRTRQHLSVLTVKMVPGQ